MMTTEAPEGTTSANGTSGKNRWFQLGLLSAGAAAPLIARWRNLRASERAEALRIQASGRWNDAREWVAQSLPQDSLQETLRQMAPQAQDSLRQVGSAARDALQRLPLSVMQQSAPAPVSTESAQTNSSRRATLWLVGVGVGVVAAGAIAYIVLRNRISSASDDDTLVEIPLTAMASTPSHTMTQASAADADSVASEEPAVTAEAPDDEPGIAEAPTFSEDDAQGAAFVGNILSRVYHTPDSKRLPAPQHRIYFASEEEAAAAGYRPDGAELASRAPDPSGQQE